MNKEELRKHQLSLRKALPDKDLHADSQAITTQCITLLSQTTAQNIHLFLPITKQREVNTWALYEYLLESPSYTPVLSKSNFEDYTLSHHPMQAGDSIEETTLGIPEPMHKRTVSPEALDLVFVPLLGFDAHGHRLGYGAGFYDRFLAECRADCLKVGLSLLPVLDSELPASEFDMALNQCITPAELYRFS